MRDLARTQTGFPQVPAKMKWPFPILCLFLFSSLLSAQPEPATICGTRVSAHQSVLHRQLNKQWLQMPRQHKTVHSAEDLILIPLQFHLINAAGELSLWNDSLLTFEVKQLNQRFAPGLIQFYQCGPALEIVSEKHSRIDPPDAAEVEALYSLDSVLNVFLPTAGDQAGFANFPPGNATVVIRQDYLGDGSILMHEIGHCLFLYHTHQGGELVNGSNCNSAGDLICDTPADPSLFQRVEARGCNYNAQLEDAQGQRYMPPVLNIMSYAPPACKVEFTPGQFARMRWAIQNFRRDLGCRQHPTSGQFFYRHDDDDPTRLHFYPLATYQELQWDFGDGHYREGEATPWHHYSKPGAYQVKLSIDKDSIVKTSSRWLYAGAVPIPYRNNFESDSALALLAGVAGAELLSDFSQGRPNRCLQLSSCGQSARLPFYNFPAASAFDPLHNPHFRSRISLWVDARHSRRLFLHFDLNQQVPDGAGHTANLRVLVNDEPISPALRVWWNNEADSSFNHHEIDLSAFDGQLFKLTFEASHSPDAQAFSLLDNLKLENAPARITAEIFPNPTTGRVWVKTLQSELESFQLFDATGRLLRNSPPAIGWEESRILLDLSQLPAGLYLLKTANASHRIYKL